MLAEYSENIGMGLEGATRDDFITGVQCRD
jgi:hypothetical protein